MKFEYISIPVNEAQKLGLLDNRILINDGKNVIVNQTDLLVYGTPEDSVEDKAVKIGGSIITANDARILIANAKK